MKKWLLAASIGIIIVGILVAYVFFITPKDGSYTNVKTGLNAEGWYVYLAPGFVSAGDKEFPEIGDCGSGLDAVCKVSFENDGLTKYLYVHKEERFGYVEWVVIGVE